MGLGCGMARLVWQGMGMELGPGHILVGCSCWDCPGSGEPPQPHNRLSPQPSTRPCALGEKGSGPTPSRSSWRVSEPRSHSPSRGMGWELCPVGSLCHGWWCPLGTLLMTGGALWGHCAIGVLWGHRHGLVVPFGDTLIAGGALWGHWAGGALWGHSMAGGAFWGHCAMTGGLWGHSAVSPPSSGHKLWLSLAVLSVVG